MKRTDNRHNPLAGLFCASLDIAPVAQLTATVNDPSLMQGVRSLAQQELDTRQLAALRGRLKTINI